jgi:hypothetical protein
MSSSPNIDQPAPSRGVIVLGMHRSGTSVLSRALIALGVDFGGTFVHVRPDNPKGFFEDKDVNSLNVSFLLAMGCRWHTLLLSAPEAAMTDSNFKEQAAVLLKSKFAGRRLWGLKDPRITRLLPLWQAALADINARGRYVLANRNPLSVADSLAKRDDIPRAQALALWALHQIDGLTAIIENGGIVVDYDFMMNQPSTEMRRLAQFLGQSIDADKQNVFLDDFLQQDLRHSYHAQTSNPSSPLFDACMVLHESLLTLARSEGPLGQNELAQAKEALAQAKQSMDLHADWFQAVDAIYRKVDDAKQALREEEARMQHLNSQLAWIERKPSVRFARSIRRIFLG